jgi:sugar lactone lactonase YvrE
MPVIQDMKTDDFSSERFVEPNSALEELATNLQFTEGPIWSAKDASLLFSDIPANRIYQWVAPNNLTVYREPSGNSNGVSTEIGDSLGLKVMAHTPCLLISSVHRD